VNEELARVEAHLDVLSGLLKEIKETITAHPDQAPKLVSAGWVQVLKDELAKIEKDLPRDADSTKLRRVALQGEPVPSRAPCVVCGQVLPETAGSRPAS